MWWHAKDRAELENLMNDGRIDTELDPVADFFPWNECIEQAALEENHSVFWALSAINAQLVGLREDLRALVAAQR